MRISFFRNVSGNSLITSVSDLFFFFFNYRALKPGLHVRRKNKQKKPACKPVRRKLKRLVLALVLCFRRPSLHVRRNDASISTSTREWNDFHSLVLVLVLVLGSYV